MKSRHLFVICSLLAGMLLTGVAVAKNSYLNSVNSTCGTNYDCGLCHEDPKGGGPLTLEGDDYVASGYDASIFCPGSSCTDGDGDGFAIEGGDCGSLDCDDSDAGTNPGAAEICDDGFDNDCDANIDCDDNECSNAPVCDTNPPEVEICDDNLDNDGDNKVDCADKKDCGKDPACSDGGGGNPPDVEICDDGIDNDGDNKIDCSDKKDCGKDPAC
jgi:hypothetical protein